MGWDSMERRLFAICFSDISKLPKMNKIYLQIYNSRAEFTRVNLICAQLNLNPDSLLTGVLFSSFPDISFNVLSFFF